MYARIATWENAAPERAQEVSDAMRSAGLPVDQQQAGWQAILAMIDEENRRVMTIALFDSEENARAADQAMRAISLDNVPDDLRALMQQAGPPTIAYARVLNREGI